MRQEFGMSCAGRKGEIADISVPAMRRHDGVGIERNAAPIVNTLKAGAGVPVRFSLGGSQGMGSSPAATWSYARSRASPTSAPTKSSRP